MVERWGRQLAGPPRSCGAPTLDSCLHDRGSVTKCGCGLMPWRGRRDAACSASGGRRARMSLSRCQAGRCVPRSDSRWELFDSDEPRCSFSASMSQIGTAIGRKLQNFCINDKLVDQDLVAPGLRQTVGNSRVTRQGVLPTVNWSTCFGPGQRQSPSHSSPPARSSICSAELAPRLRPLSKSRAATTKRAFPHPREIGIASP
jgi:hypothetical protein